MSAISDLIDAGQPLELIFDLQNTDGSASSTQLYPYEMSGEDRMGDYFEYRVLIFTYDDSLVDSQFLGKSATLQLDLDGLGNYRYFNGVFGSFGFRNVLADSDGTTLYCYEATLVPTLWEAGQNKRSRAFCDMRVLDVVKQILGEWNVNYNIDSIADQTTDSIHPQYELLMQYEESDLNFIRRLLQREGMYYYFQHTYTDPSTAQDDNSENSNNEDTGGKHTMYIVNTPSAHTTFNSSYATIGFINTRDYIGSRQYIWSIRSDSKMYANKSVSQDYNFRLSSQNNQDISKPTATLTAPYTDVTQFNYPAGNTWLNANIPASDANTYGTNLVTYRAEASRSATNTMVGASNARGIAVGYKYEIDGHPYFSSTNENNELLTRETAIAAFNSSFGIYGLEHSPTAGDLTDFSYNCDFVCQLETMQYRSAYDAPQPVVTGPMTAVVVGENSQYVDGGDDATSVMTDKYGRVEVRFHWMRDDDAQTVTVGTNNDSKQLLATCLIRVSQPMAGQNFGMLMLPRSGEEVLVEFEQGNPDRPIVVGRVFNENYLPPYDLTDTSNLGRTVIRSRTLGKETTAIPTAQLIPKESSTSVYSTSPNTGSDYLSSVKQYNYSEVAFNDTTSTDQNPTTAMSFYASGDVVTQTPTNVTINAGDTLTLAAGNTIKLKVGDSVLTLTGKKATLAKTDIPGLSSTLSLDGQKVSIKANQFSATGWIKAGMKTIMAGYSAELWYTSTRAIKVGNSAGFNLQYVRSMSKTWATHVAGGSLPSAVSKGYTAYSMARESSNLFWKMLNSGSIGEALANIIGSSKLEAAGNTAKIETGWGDLTIPPLPSIKIPYIWPPAKTEVKSLLKVSTESVGEIQHKTASYSAESIFKEWKTVKKTTTYVKHKATVGMLTLQAISKERQAASLNAEYAEIARKIGTIDTTVGDNAQKAVNLGVQAMQKKDQATVLEQEAANLRQQAALGQQQ